MFAEAMSSLFASPAPVRRVNASLENPAFSLNDPAAYEFLGGGHKSASGVTVTHSGSLRLATVFQAISLISGDVSKLPLYPYKRLPEDDREVATKHPAYFAVAFKANPFKSAKRFWRDLMVHALLWGNGYAYISRSGKGIELYNLLPDRTAPEWMEIEDARGKRTELVYVTEVDGALRTLPASSVLHIRGISLDGLKGADLTIEARDAWGLALSAQNFKSKFFKNGARMGGTLELPTAMTKPARDQVEEGFRKTYEEGDNPFKTVILREGAKFHAGQVTPQEGQISELSDEQRREIASYFDLPPSKLGIRDSVSYNSFEQDNLAYRHGCLHHWSGDIADECDMKLLSDKELRDDSHYFEHNYSKFEQADWATLNEGLEVMRRNEVINADEWRRKLNMNKRPDGKGGEYINPNTRSADSQKTKEEPDDTDEQETPKVENVAARQSFTNLLSDALVRMCRRVGRDARDAAKKPATFLNWLDNKSAVSDHKALVDGAVKPIAQAAAMVLSDLNAENLAAKASSRFFESIIETLSPLVEPGNSAADLAANVDRELLKFELTISQQLAAELMETENV